MPKPVTQAIEVRGRDRTKGAFKSVNRGLSGLTSGIGRALPLIAGLAGAAGFGALIKGAFSAGDNLGKMADRLGASTKGLAAIHHAAQLAGSSIEGTDKAIEKMVRTLGDISKNLSSTQVKVFEDLGLNIDEILEKNADEQFEEIAVAISGLSTQAEKASAAAQLFGRSGIQMLNVMEGVATNIEQAKDETEKFGTALTRVEIAKLEETNDAAHRVGESVRGIANVIALSVAPALTSIADWLSDFVSGGLKDYVTGVAGLFSQMADAIKDARKALIDLGLLSGNTEYMDALQAQAKAQAKINELHAIRRRMEKEGHEDLPDVIDALGHFINKHKEATREVERLEAAMKKVAEEQNKPKITAPTISTGGEEDPEMNPASKLVLDYKDAWQTIQGDALIFYENMNRIRGENAALLAESEAETNPAMEEVKQWKDAFEVIPQAQLEAYEYMNKNREEQREAVRKDAELKRKIEEQTTRDTIGTFKYLGMALGKHSKAGFRITKAAGIAEAIINTHKGITKALELPFPANIAAAAVTAAKGFASVAAIKSTSMGGGSTGSAPVGGNVGLATNNVASTVTGTATAGVQPEQSRQTIRIEAKGSRFSAEEVGDIIRQIAEATGDNVTANIGAA